LSKYLVRFVWQVLICVFCLVDLTAQTPADTPWAEHKTAFMPIDITANPGGFWVVGTNDGIATSSNGKSWTTRHLTSSAGNLLLGIEFLNQDFGYAWGTSGAVWMTTDGGASWQLHQVGNATILAASFSDPDHGIIRTSEYVGVFESSGLRALKIPSTVPKTFTYAPAVVALSEKQMIVALSEGWRSRTGFLSTIDGGASWSFYEPPHVVPYQLFRNDGEYWTVGTETLEYDKPGGGFGVPNAMSSTDGQSWQRTPANLRVCHWEGCHLCRQSRCFASATLLADVTDKEHPLLDIPTGHLTPQWALSGDTLCTIESGSVWCTEAATTEFVDKAGSPQPGDQALPPLGTKAKDGLLRCIRCGFDQFIVDDKAQGQFQLKVALKVHADGTVQVVSLDGAPNAPVHEKLMQQISLWLFEPPTKDGHGVNVATTINPRIQVIRSR